MEEQAIRCDGVKNNHRPQANDTPRGYTLYVTAIAKALLLLTTNGASWWKLVQDHIHFVPEGVPQDHTFTLILVCLEATRLWQRNSFSYPAADLGLCISQPPSNIVGNIDPFATNKLCPDATLPTVSRCQFFRTIAFSLYHHHASTIFHPFANPHNGFPAHSRVPCVHFPEREPQCAELSSYDSQARV